MNKDVELELIIVARTAAAYLVSDADVEVWLPMSQITIEEGDIEIGGVYSFLIPEWLATEKGLV